MPFDISPLRMHPESFEHERNIPARHKNVPEYLECTQNAVRMFQMQFNYHRLYYTSSFQRHSSSFQY